MVNTLLSLITPPRTTLPSDSVDRERTQQHLLRSALTRIGVELSPSFHDATQSSRSHVALDDTAPSLPTPRALFSGVTSLVSSPQRRRKNNNNNTSENIENITPRRGEKSKQRRTSSLTSEDNSKRADISRLSGTARYNEMFDNWSHYSSVGFGIHGKPSTDFDGWRRLHLDRA